MTTVVNTRHLWRNAHCCVYCTVQRIGEGQGYQRENVSPVTFNPRPCFHASVSVSIETLLVQGDWGASHSCPSLRSSSLLVSISAVASEGENDNLPANRRCMTEVSNLCLVLLVSVCAGLQYVISCSNNNPWLKQHDDKKKKEKKVKDLWRTECCINMSPVPKLIPDRHHPCLIYIFSLACITSINHEIRLLFLNKMQITTGGVTHSSHRLHYIFFNFHQSFFGKTL